MFVFLSQGLILFNVGHILLATLYQNSKYVGKYRTTSIKIEQLTLYLYIHMYK